MARAKCSYGVGSEDEAIHPFDLPNKTNNNSSLEGRREGELPP